MHSICIHTRGCIHNLSLCCCRNCVFFGSVVVGVVFLGECCCVFVLGNFFSLFSLLGSCASSYGVGGGIWVGDIGARSALGGEYLDGHAGWRSSKKVSAYHHPVYYTIT